MFDQLLKYFHKVKDRKITSLFEQDKNRAMNFSILQEDLFLDFSKTNIDQPIPLCDDCEKSPLV